MKRYGVLIVGIVAALVCVRLGWWQLDRLATRREWRRDREASLAQPPVPVTAAARSGRRAEARGVFDFTREILVTGRSAEGLPAVHVLTPLRLPGGEALLVERGAAYAPDGRTVDLATLGEPDTALVRGVLLEGTASRWLEFGQGAWPLLAGSNHPDQFTARYPYPLLPLVLRRTELPAGAPPTLRPIPLPPTDDGPHLSYAIQWFAFAVIALVGSVALSRRESVY